MLLKAGFEDERAVHIARKREKKNGMHIGY
jgi:hypothetical protein